MTGSDGEIRVLLVSPLAVVRAGLTLLIDHGSGMKTVGEATTTEEAATLISDLASVRDLVVLVDLALIGRRDPFWLIRYVRETRPTVKILATGARSDRSAVARALFMGADGYADQCTEPEEFLDAITSCSAGMTIITGENRNRIASIIAALDEHAQGEVLSSREVQVLEAAADGGTARDIALQLSLAERTVTTHLSRIYTKLGVNSRIAALSKARSMGLIAPLSEAS